MMHSATRTNEMVASFFPKNVRERLFKQVEAEQQQNTAGRFGLRNGETSRMLMEKFLTAGRDDLLVSEPIAVCFPHTTVLFLDVSTRNPLSRRGSSALIIISDNSCLDCRLHSLEL